MLFKFNLEHTVHMYQLTHMQAVQDELQIADNLNIHIGKHSGITCQ